MSEHETVSVSLAFSLYNDTVTAAAPVKPQENS